MVTKDEGVQQLALDQAVTPSPYVYFSGPLTWYDRNGDSRLPEVLAAAETVEGCLASKGIKVYVPHREYKRRGGRHTHADNTAAISQAMAVVAYYDFPSTGMGQELEIAAAHLRPVVLLVNQRRDKISTMVTTGPFARIVVVFDDIPDLSVTLPPAIDALAKPYDPPQSGTEAEFGPRLAAARRDAGMAREEFARRLGVSIDVVAGLESPVVAANPTLWQVGAMSRALDVPLMTLLGADGSADLRERVLEYAADHGRSASEVREVLALAARGAATAILEDAQMEVLFDIIAGSAAGKQP
jgi:transcriptional regulator with XRE-family HTH domain